MTDCPPVSVIVVSHGRPALLRRALAGIGQLFYRPFELVVIADDTGLAAIADLPLAARIKTARQDVANISAARNRGADLAGGDILAFIDDDAVPEPTWLNHLVSPLTETHCAAVTGTVLGRNGISVQWADRVVDACGCASRAPNGNLPAGLAVKLEGTNMGIRRDVLAALEGFDEGFRFYLDETDLSYRLMKAGQVTAFAPLATVHHGFAESVRRRADRVPLSVWDIGVSSALYLRKHAPPEWVEPALEALRQEQTARLARWREAGRLDDAGMQTLLTGLEDGIVTGRGLPLATGRAIVASPPFKPLVQTEPPPPVVLSGRWFSRTRLERRARSCVAQGHSTSLFLFGHTVRAHSVRFTKDGVWQQSGGLFGPSRRDQARFTNWSFRARIAQEFTRLEGIRWTAPLRKWQDRAAPRRHTGYQDSKSSES